jgi:hypothetical protein
MKNLIIFGLFVIALVFVQFAQAQTVDEVINKYMDALGGKDKLATLTSVYMEGVSVRNGNETTSKTYKVQDKLYRYDVNFGMGSFTILVTPEKGWQTNFRNGGAFEPMTDETLKGFLPQIDCAGPMVNYATKGHKAELTGKETVDSIDCFKIKLTTKAGKEIDYWIDSKTYLIHQSSQKTAGRNGEVELITVYTDYKAVDGIPFPFTATLKGGGFGGGTVNYEKIELNKPVDDKLYKPE